MRHPARVRDPEVRPRDAAPGRAGLEAAMRGTALFGVGLGAVVLALGGLFLWRAEPVSAQDADTQMIGEIRMYAGDTPPVGWALCNGA